MTLDTHRFIGSFEMTHHEKGTFTLPREFREPLGDEDLMIYGRPDQTEIFYLIPETTWIEHLQGLPQQNVLTQDYNPLTDPLVWHGMCTYKKIEVPERGKVTLPTELHGGEYPNGAAISLIGIRQMILGYLGGMQEFHEKYKGNNLQAPFTQNEVWVRVS